MKTYAFGFPRLGKNREFKKLVENYFKGNSSEEELLVGIADLNRKRESTYSQFVDGYPKGEMTLYDNMLDMALAFNVHKTETLKDYFALCRGKNALEMTKWFNTNYHYLVPNFNDKDADFGINELPFGKYDNGSENAYLIGPLTFLKLSKNLHGEFSDNLERLVNTYISFMKKMNFKSVHMDDPAFVTELNDDEWKATLRAYQKFEKINAKINLFTYYDSVDRLENLFELPVNGIGIDLLHDRGENLEKVKSIKTDKMVFIGIVDGRNIWRTNIFEKAKLAEELAKDKNIALTNAAPLFHLPVTTENVNVKADRDIKPAIAFATERLKELKLIKDTIEGKTNEAKRWISKVSIPFERDKNVIERVKSLKPSDFERKPSLKERRIIQERILKLPLFPTTTIGSFPQTDDVRRIRLLRKKGKLSQDDYECFIKGEIAKAIYIQDSIGLDVLVHGEFERSDMVEFFAEKLNGIATTDNGWVISYGTRCYRPPIIHGDINRPKPMTVNEIAFAQSLTKKPVKGMITGPVTIISWSYCRNDISLREVAYQIALCIKDEIKDYESAGIKVVQIDEPAFREKAPIKKRYWDTYFDWAVKAFRLCHSSAKPETQIHSHMCYSEFGDIINYIKQMDFDVISIEASRSKGDIIKSFENANFEAQIGLGVWDIHSPYVPSVDEMMETVKRALKVIPKENFWINPDCGLKTRRWEEVIPALINIVSLAKSLRHKFKEN